LLAKSLKIPKIKTNTFFLKTKTKTLRFPRRIETTQDLGLEDWLHHWAYVVHPIRCTFAISIEWLSGQIVQNPNTKHGFDLHKSTMYTLSAYQCICFISLISIPLNSFVFLLYMLH